MPATARAIMETDWYRLLYPELRIERNTAQQLTTTRMGGRLAVSAGGAATGFGADFLIVDDLMKAADARLPSARQGVKEYYEQTLFSRLNDKDLAAYLIDKVCWPSPRSARRWRSCWAASISRSRS